MQKYPGSEEWTFFLHRGQIEWKTTWLSMCTSVNLCSLSEGKININRNYLYTSGSLLLIIIKLKGDPSDSILKNSIWFLLLGIGCLLYLFFKEEGELILKIKSCLSTKVSISPILKCIKVMAFYKKNSSSSVLNFAEIFPPGICIWTKKRCPGKKIREKFWK